MAMVDKPPTYYEAMRARLTAQGILAGFPNHVAEVIVVDNDPHPGNPIGSTFDADGKVVQRGLDLASGGRVRYIPFGSVKGTAAPRNLIFEQAAHRRVAVVDSHVVLLPGFFDALDEMYESDPNRGDLLHGPMMLEDLINFYAHHMNDQWRAEMWGTWGLAWEKDGFQFSCVKPNEQTEDLIYVILGQPGGQRALLGDEIKELGLPTVGWSGHERVLRSVGCTHPTEPFLIPDHGMGFFACLKDKWLPFHPDCRGFGGEEMTTGYRFRRSGRSVWCVPGAKWWHDFWRPMQGCVPYRLTRWDRVRNYVLEFERLGMSLEPIRRHFVDAARISSYSWDQIVRGKDRPTGSFDRQGPPQPNPSRRIKEMAQ
jgi:hypothetical protein